MSLITPTVVVKPSPRKVRGGSITRRKESERTELAALFTLGNLAIEQPTSQQAATLFHVSPTDVCKARARLGVSPRPRKTKPTPAEALASALLEVATTHPGQDEVVDQLLALTLKLEHAATAARRTNGSAAHSI